MKPRLQLNRITILVMVVLYALAAISIIKLLPWFESLAARGPEETAGFPAGANGMEEQRSRLNSTLPNPFSAIDFSDPESVITIQITPPHSSEAIEIQFLTGQSCNYADHRACVHHYQTDSGQQVIFLTIHSGMDGEAERLRHYLEGTGINRAGYSLKQARAAIASLRGARVTIQQGEQAVNSLQLSTVGRIPPGALKAYFSAPYERALNQAAAADSALEKYVYAEQPLIVLETCGWRMPGEKSSTSASDTTGSIYLAVIEPR